jgi:hypothetical protein
VAGFVTALHIAEGLATVLQHSPTPEPLGVDLVGQTPAGVTFLIRAVVDACERCAVPLSTIRVGLVCASNAIRALGPEPLHYEGVPVEPAFDLDHRLELYRFAKS